MSKTDTFEELRAKIDAANAGLTSFFMHMQRLACTLELSMAIAKEYSPSSYSSDRWVKNTIGTQRKISVSLENVPDTKKFENDSTFRNAFISQVIQDALDELNSNINGIEFFVDGDVMYHHSTRISFTVDFK